MKKFKNRNLLLIKTSRKLVSIIAAERDDLTEGG